MSGASRSAVPAFASTVGHVLSRSAARSPDRLALTFAGRSWTYAEFDRAAGRERLASHKVPKSVHFVDALPKKRVGQAAQA
jgi:non-ribosomal peptide synthetase component E (peptide arylation enzyme)